MFIKPIPKEIKEEIMAKVAQGIKAPTLANQYGISSKTIYGWLSKTVAPEITWARYQQIKRENAELKRLVGIMALDLERGKKRKVSSFIN